MRICNEEESTIIPYLYFHLPFLYFLDIRDDRTVAEQPIRMCIHMRFCVKIAFENFVVHSNCTFVHRTNVSGVQLLSGLMNTDNA